MNHFRFFQRLLLAASFALSLFQTAAAFDGFTQSAETHIIPAFSHKAPIAYVSSEVATFAGGCFWGVQGVFQHVKGVKSAISGYAGGDQKTANYSTVSSGMTAHAESVQITFDPRKISYAQLLQVYFSVAHDPTQINRQGPDVGPQYRSAIFPTSDEQGRTARAYIAELNQAHVFNQPIATRIELDKHFFPAEDYHQDFLTLHPTNPYIAFNDLPKIHDLERLFPQLYRANPVLVSAHH